ncbi:hypothetical protein FE773_03635 [Caminibacter mediatlanticus TB-2]|uniref:Lipoprotein n=1 Tax=Caminibacter mediatlanticus TB-2 TaxID=391592 RepID=A0ABX5V7P9_9BACT|nr:hypothetical protein [Caminibacter mediatlanticus]QCT94303.1 hypothetical protein FE773_03635 [Caminibacter mediatlanticus TB-2]
MKKLNLILLGSLVFIGCSSKNFEPKTFINKKLPQKERNSYLQDYTKNTLTFKELKLKYTTTSFFDDGIRGEWVYFDEEGNKLEKFVKVNKDLAKRGDKLLLIKEKKVVKMPYLIASATKKNNLIALVFENNSIGIYDLNKDKIVFYKQYPNVLAAKYLKSSPLFYDNLILFPLLNSKVAIYDLANNKFLRDIDLADDNIINNIIFMKIVDNSLFISTPSRLILFNPNFLVNYNADIKHIIDYNGYLYLFLINGKIVKLDTKLKKIKEIKLPFADFFAPSVCNGNIYTIANKYLIKITPDLNVTVYGGNDFDLDSPLNIKNCKIYNSNKVYFIE